jgi:parvulin-like peptidyl-prolyl isomerase
VKRNVLALLPLLVSLGIVFSLLAEAKGEDKVAATVNGEKVLSSQVDNKVSKYKDIDPSLIPSLRQDILEEIIADVLVQQFIRKEGIEVKQQAVDEAVENIRKRMKSNLKTADVSLEDALAAYNSNLDELKKDIKNSLGIKTYFTRDLNDKTLEQYFLKNKDVYSGEMVRASHILIDTRMSESPEELAKAKSKMEEIKKELDKGADFGELAKRFSDCPSAERGGDLGYFPRKGAVVEPFAETAFKLKTGEISDPVKTEFGYHIIKVSDKKEAKAVNFEEVKEQVKENYLEDETANLIKKLRTEAQVDIKE